MNMLNFMLRGNLRELKMIQLIMRHNLRLFWEYQSCGSIPLEFDFEIFPQFLKLRMRRLFA